MESNICTIYEQFEALLRAHMPSHGARTVKRWQRVDMCRQDCFKTASKDDPAKAERPSAMQHVSSKHSSTSSPAKLLHARIGVRRGRCRRSWSRRSTLRSDAMPGRADPRDEPIRPQDPGPLHSRCGLRGFFGLDLGGPETATILCVAIAVKICTPPSLYLSDLLPSKEQSS